MSNAKNNLVKQFENKTTKELTEYGIINGFSFKVEDGKIVEVVEDKRMSEFCKAMQERDNAIRAEKQKEMAAFNNKLDEAAAKLSMKK